MNTELVKRAFTPFTIDYCVSGSIMTATAVCFYNKNSEDKNSVFADIAIILTGCIWGPYVIFPICGSILGSVLS